MTNTRPGECKENDVGKVGKVYYVRGSGWIPIPSSRLGEIPVVVREYHDRAVHDAGYQRMQLYRRA